MKTIPQIAEEIGVSRQAVNRKIKQEPLSTSLRNFTSTLGNVVYIDEDGQNLIKSAFIKNQMSTSKVNTFTDMTTQYMVNLQNRIDFLERQNQELQEELKDERNHNREQMDKLTALIDKQTELTVQVAELVQTNQLLLGREQSRNNSVLMVDSEMSSSPSVQAEAREKPVVKKSLFQKILKKVSP